MQDNEKIQPEEQKPVINRDTGFVVISFDEEHPARNDGSEYTEKQIDQERGIAYRALLALLPHYGAVKLMGEMDAMDHGIPTRFDIVAEYLRLARGENKVAAEVETVNNEKQISDRASSVLETIEALPLSVSALDALGRMKEYHRYRTDKPVSENGIDAEVMDELINNDLAFNVSSEFAGEIKACSLTSAGVICSAMFNGMLKDAVAKE